MDAAAALLLDTVTGAAVAYSLRKLRNDAVNAIRVRRSVDDAEQDIGFSGNDLDTASLLTFAGAGNAFVVTKYDQSTNSRNITQANGLLQPRIVNAGSLEVDELGNPWWVLDGIDDWLRATGFTVAQPSTHMLVAKRDTTSIVQVWSDGALTGARNLIYLSTGPSEYIWASTPVTLSDAPSTARQQRTALFNGASSQAWKDGTSVGTGNPGTQSMTGVTLGAAYDNSSRLTGKYQEFIIWPSDLGADRATAEADMRAYWGTP